MGHPPLSRSRGGVWGWAAARWGAGAAWARAGAWGVNLVDAYLAAKQRRLAQAAWQEQQRERRLERLNRRARLVVGGPQRSDLAAGPSAPTAADPPTDDAAEPLPADDASPQVASRGRGQGRAERQAAADASPPGGTSYYR